MTSSDRVLIEVVVAATVEDVWRALRDPAEVRRWFGWDYAGLEDEIELIFSSASASEADHTIQFGEWEGASDRIVLEPRDAKTVVRVVRSAPTGATGWEGIYNDVVEGWITFMQQLRFALERHHGEDRRTVYLSGRAKADAGRLPANALGLNGVAGVSVGQPYSTKTAIGDTLAGQVWFRTEHQLGLSVSDYGDGLLVVARQPATDKAPFGGGSVVLTTYGLDDRAFEGLQRRWTDWWASQYETTSANPS